MSQRVLAVGPYRPLGATPVDARALHLGWFAAVALLAFAIPYVFSSLLSLQHDLYYLVYFGLVGGLLSAYLASTGADVWGALRRNWLPSLVLGFISGAFVVSNVLSRPATPGPQGLYLAFEVLWRGLAYGVVDALLLTAFPGLVASGLLGNNLNGAARRVGFAALALTLSLIITGTYHLGGMRMGGSHA